MALHYAVTTRLWRGLFDRRSPVHPIIGQLRRACDWTLTSAYGLVPLSEEDRIGCDDCRAYIVALRRLGILRWPAA